MRILALAFICLAGALHAAPVQYTLDTAASQVAFSYDFEGQTKQGSMPVKAADIWLDLDNVPGSRVDVTLNAAGAKAGFVFATQTMKGARVLNTAAHPTIRFRSTSFRGNLNGATVKGHLTVRGVTKAVTLRAQLFRQSGTALDDRDNLAVLLTGEINRNDFDADGFPGYVGPMIGLRILAHINR